MDTDVTKMAQDMGDRVRDLAYLMWESAGRQQGMALDYWLAAEKEVAATLQTASKMVPPKAQKRQKTQ